MYAKALVTLAFSGSAFAASVGYLAARNASDACAGIAAGKYVCVGALTCFISFI